MKTLITTLCLLLLASQTLWAQAIDHYTPTTSLCHSPNGLFIGIRKFNQNGIRKYLIVDVEKLETEIATADEVKCVPSNFQEIRNEFSNSNYLRALTEIKTNSHQLQNAGITHFSRRQDGVDVTVDLCPSPKPLDRILFTSLVDHLGKVELPVPVALAVSGLWLTRHQEDLDWLFDLEKKNLLKITWVNHSYSHPYSRTLPDSKNFLLQDGVDVTQEVLRNEIVMLQKGITPSLFFRFPGLVSDETAYRKITELGLLAIGSEAWIAKGERPQDGSIVLLHGNGNEIMGITKFIKILEQEKENILDKKWLLHDLSESLIEDIIDGN